jgi:hypothetical protein
MFNVGVQFDSGCRIDAKAWHGFIVISTSCLEPPVLAVFSYVIHVYLKRERLFPRSRRE